MELKFTEKNMIGEQLDFEETYLGMLDSGCLGDISN